MQTSGRSGDAQAGGASEERVNARLRELTEHTRQVRHELERMIRDRERTLASFGRRAPSPRPSSPRG